MKRVMTASQLETDTGIASITSERQGEATAGLSQVSAEAAA